MTADLTTALRAMESLLRELFDGANSQAAWVLNRDDRGFLETLSEISSEAASQSVAPERKSIAAHAHHVRFHLDLLNRWAAGDETAFTEANWSEGWGVQTVSAAEWRELIESLTELSARWIAAIPGIDDWDEISLTGAIASAVHVAYHLSAVRQIALIVAR